MTIQKGVFAEKSEIETADKPKGEYIVYFKSIG